MGTIFLVVALKGNTRLFWERVGGIATVNTNQILSCTHACFTKSCLINSFLQKHIDIYVTVFGKTNQSADIRVQARRR